MRLIDQLHGWQLWFYIFLIGGSAVGAILFALCYAVLTRWWEDAYGKFMMYLGAVLALALGNSASRLFFPPAPWVSVVVTCMVFALIWWCLILFLVTYSKARRSRKRREDRRNEKK